jgi:hypothetical protein
VFAIGKTDRAIPISETGISGPRFVGTSNHKQDS